VWLLPYSIYKTIVVLLVLNRLFVCLDLTGSLFLKIMVRISVYKIHCLISEPIEI